MTIPLIDSATAFDQNRITHLEDSTMETTVCQAVDTKTIEIADEQVTVDSIMALSSTEMSFVGGGLMAVCFA